MKSSFILGLLGALAAPAFAAPAPSFSTHVVHERRETIPAAWVKRDALPASRLLPVRIGLTQRNLEKGYDMLMDVSHPESPNYGKHYTVEEVTEIFAPSQETVDAIEEWLVHSGIPSETISQSTNKGWMQFDATAEDMERILKTKYHYYEHEATGYINIACDEYHIPQEIKHHVDYITPGIKLFVGKTRGINKEKRDLKRPPTPKKAPIPEALLQQILADPIANDTCSEAVTPECIKVLYGIPPGTKAAPGNNLGIFESLEDIYSQVDLNNFFTTFTPFIPNGTHPVHQLIDGATAPQPILADAGVESDLDFEIAYPIVWPQQTSLYQTDDNHYQTVGTDGFFNTFLDALDGSYCTSTAFGETGDSPLDPVYPDPAPGGFKGQLQCGVYKPTNVISISYGGQESDLPANYQQRQCQEFMKLALQGTTTVMASGDSGVAGRNETSSDICLGPDNRIFSPDFAATCPFILAVGATQIVDGAPVTAPETAVEPFGSGGGFSNIYPIPSYQASAVATFFRDHDPPYPFYSSVHNNSFGANGGIYNRLGRGYPDVSANGLNAVVFTEGGAFLVGGTSMSTPIWASILTRINEERLAVKKSTVGFVHPTLYANPDVFNDIVTGNNSAGGACGTNGFSAVKGWDPVTGLGTPKYEQLLSVFLSLP